MLRLFDYVYYRLSFIYKRSEIVDGVNLNAFGVLASIQSLTIFNIYLLIYYLVIEDFPDAWHIIPVFTVFSVLNWTRYFSEGIVDQSEEKWSNESKAKKSLNDKLIISYFILIIFLPIAFAVIARIYFK